MRQTRTDIRKDPAVHVSSSSDSIVKQRWQPFGRRSVNLSRSRPLVSLNKAHTLTEAETFSSRSCDQGAVLPGDEKATRVRCSVAAPPSMAVYRGKAFQVSTRFFEKTSSNMEVPDTAAEMGAGALWNRVPCRKAIGALAGAHGPVRWRALLRLPPTSTRRVAPGPALRCLPSPRPPTQLVVRDAAREAAASAEFPASRVLQGGQRHVSQAAERVGVEPGVGSAVPCVTRAKHWKSASKKRSPSGSTRRHRSPRPPVRCGNAAARLPQCGEGDRARRAGARATLSAQVARDRLDQNYLRSSRNIV